MKKYKISLLITIFFMLLIFSIMSMSLNSGKADQSSPQVQEFISKIGFTGDYTASGDDRIVSVLAGKFNLPVPKDSIALQANMDKIADDFNAFYQKQGASFTLKRTHYDDKYKSCQYVQSWKSFYLENQPYFLLVTYHPETDTYSIQNTLYMKPVVIPDRVINLISVGRILSYITGGINVKADFASFQPEYAATDSIKTINEYGEEDYQKILIKLNLYPVYGDSGSPEFCLQWKYHKYHYRDKDIYIDAQTGNLTGSAATEWQEKNLLLKAAQDFIDDNGLSGKCKFFLDGNRFAFYGFKAPVVIKDTLSFHKLTDKYVTALRKMYKQLGSDVSVDFKDITTSSGDNVTLYYATYVQKFRYPMFENFGDLQYQIRFTMNIISGILDIETELRPQPREYPQYVLSPQAVIGIAKLMSKHAPGSLAYKTAYDKLSQDKVNINTIPYLNIYTKSKTHKVARLRVIPIFKGQDEASAELKLAWYVNDDNRDTYCILNPATGVSFYPLSPSNFQPIDTEIVPHIATSAEEIKLKLAFLPLGTASNFSVNEMFPDCHSFEAKFHFPVDNNSADFEKKCRSMLDILLSLNKMNTPDYTFETYKNSDELYAGLYYKGFYVKIPWVGMYMSSSVVGSYDADTKKYYVTYYLKPLDYQMPEYVLTPQTAIAISSNKTNLPYAWTELANLSGKEDYGTEPSNFYDGYYEAVLALLPFKKQNSDNEYEYKLAWLISYSGFEGGCQPDKIDAVTGEFLKDEIDETSNAIY